MEVTAEEFTAALQQAHDIGWLGGFSSTIWALVSVQGNPPVVADEAAVEFDRVAARLRRSAGLDGGGDV